MFEMALWSGLRRDAATLVTFLAAAKNAVGLAAATSRCNGRRSGRGARQPEGRKGRIVGQKAPFKLEDNWALRVRLQMENRVRQLALFNLGIDSKLRGCDLVALKVRDVCHGDQLASRAVVLQLR